VPRLYWRIYLHFLGVLLAVGLAASVVFAVGQRGAFQRQVAERAARHVGALVAEALDDPARLARRLDQLHADLDVDVAVRDRDGRLLAAAGRTLRPPAPAEAAEARAGRLTAEGRREWLVTAPVRAAGGGDVVAILQVAVPRRFGPGRPGLAVAAVLVVMGLAAAPLARRISRPVERLTEAARRIGRGELAYRIPSDPRAGRWRRRHRRADELSELTRAFNEMAERVERLVAGQKALLANVSHELRSPLARIRVALALVPRDAEGEARVRDVERDLVELDRLIEDVLSMARLDATGLPPHPGPVEARALLTELAERAVHDPVTAGRAVHVAAGPPVALVADGPLLKRALWNLVENAAKYGAPPITLAAGREGGQVTLAVSDAGEGIAAAERERVLAPFYRVDRARTPAAPGASPRGFGLGLAFARGVAEVHGGRIAIGPATTEEGRERGCRVTITLPAGPRPP
jgi:signal transduction histidine kinase